MNEAKEDRATPLNELALDAVLKEAAEYERVGDAARYDAGIIYKRIQKDRLWKLRVGAGGKPLYTGIKSFVLAELPVGYDWFCKMIRVAERFSRDDVRTYGASALCALLAADASAQPELFDALKAGRLRSKREIQAKARELVGSDMKKRGGVRYVRTVNEVLRVAKKLAGAHQRRHAKLASELEALVAKLKKESAPLAHGVPTHVETLDQAAE